MSTRRNLDVTLSHEDAVKVSRILLEYAASKRGAAQRTKNAAIRVGCHQWADDATEQAGRIVRALYKWEG